MNTGGSKTEEFGTKESANSSVPIPLSGTGAFAIRHRLAIIFSTLAVCGGGVDSGLRMPSSLFPETGFPRRVILPMNPPSPRPSPRRWDRSPPRLRGRVRVAGSPFPRTRP